MTDKSEVVELLRDLGDKVGKTGEEAWPYLIEHVVVDSWVRIIGTVLALVAALVLSKCLAKRIKSGEGLEDGVTFTLMMITGVVCLVSTMTIFIELIPSVIKLGAPEGYLIRELLGR